MRSPASLGAERVPLGWMTQRHLVPLADSRMKGRALSVTIWLASATVYWVLLALIARIPTATAMRVTDVLFVVALPLTYGAILGGVLGLSGRPREAALRATAVTLGLILALGLLELAAVARIAHWELVFMALRGEQQHYVPDRDLGLRHVPGMRWSGWPRSDVEWRGDCPRRSRLRSPLPTTWAATAIPRR